MKFSLTRDEAESLIRTIKWVLTATTSTDEERNKMISILAKLQHVLNARQDKKDIPFEIN